MLSGAGGSREAATALASRAVFLEHRESLVQRPRHSHLTSCTLGDLWAASYSFKGFCPKHAFFLEKKETLNISLYYLLQRGAETRLRNLKLFLLLNTVTTLLCLSFNISLLLAESEVAVMGPGTRFVPIPQNPGRKSSKYPKTGIHHNF